MEVSASFVLVVTAAVEAFVAVFAIPHLLPANSLTYMFFEAVVLNFFVYGIYRIVVYPRFVSPLRHLPGPKITLWPWGQVSAIYERPPATRLMKWSKEVPNDGFIRFPGLFGRDLVFVTSPKGLGDVLVSRSYSFGKPKTGQAFLRKFLGDGLVVTEGDQHKFQRRNTLPIFSFRYIKDLYPTLWKKAVELLERVEKDSAGRKTWTMDLGVYSMKVAMDMIGITTLGRELRTLANAQDPLINNYEELFEPTTSKEIYQALGVVFGPGLLDMLPWKLCRTMDKSIMTLRQVCRELVVTRKEQIKQGDNHLDILSLLIKSNNFSNDELVDHTLTFLASGHETTAGTFEWVVYMLAKHPNIQTRLRSELQSISLNLDIVDPHTPDVATKLESLPLLNGILNETIRLCPAIPVTQREAQEDLTIDWQRFPRGTLMIIAPWAINRLTNLWGPDAEYFRPERWIDSDTGRPNNHGGVKNNYAFLSFLHGPKSCVGMSLARAELRCLVGAWVSKYEFKMQNPNEEITPAGGVTVKPKNGLHLKVTKIDS